MAPMTVRATPRMTCGRYPRLRISLRTDDSCFRERPALRIIIIVVGRVARGNKKAAGGDLRRNCGCWLSEQSQAPVRRAGKPIPTCKAAGKLRTVRNHAGHGVQRAFMGQG